MIPLLDMAGRLLRLTEWSASSSDRRLVRSCLRGEETAWEALIEKYKRLVFAIALESGADREEAAEVFQAVWIETHAQLSDLHGKASVRPWLISTALRQCELLSKKRRARGGTRGPVSRGAATQVDVETLEKDQLVREAIRQLSPRCRQVTRMLFFANPPQPSLEVARKLGIGIDALDSLREHCLRRLQRALESRGVA